MIKEDKYAGYWIRRFLGNYLKEVRNLSSNTYCAYRDAIRLLMSFVSRVTGKNVDTLLLEDISDQIVIQFLDFLEKERGCSTKTRNLRLATLVSLATFVSYYSPEHIEWSRSIKAIPMKKTINKLVTYLEKKEIEALLSLPNQKSEQGFRDYTMLLFMYNTGTRADEVASLSIADLTIEKGSKLDYVTIVGKGNKTRRCPLWKKTCQALNILIQGRDVSEPVFINRLGNPITRFGVYELVTRYATVLAKNMPVITEKRLTPHTIRHTTATHLLQAGVDINTIRAWLGHVSVETTNIYAEVNLQMKAKAIQKCEVKGNVKANKHWRNDKGLMAFLDSIV